MSNVLMTFNIPDTVAAAFRVLGNHYGVGQERRQGLVNDGYDPISVQSCVDDLIKLFDKYGG